MKWNMERGSVDILACGLFHAPTEPPEKVSTGHQLWARQKYQWTVTVRPCSCTRKRISLHWAIRTRDGTSYRKFVSALGFRLSGLQSLHEPALPHTFQCITSLSIWPCMKQGIYYAGSQDIPHFSQQSAIGSCPEQDEASTHPIPP